MAEMALGECEYCVWEYEGLGYQMEREMKITDQIDKIMLGPTKLLGHATIKKR
jgi:hypothetical protein